MCNTTMPVEYGLFFVTLSKSPYDMNGEPIKRTFQQWGLAELRKTFGLQKIVDMPELIEWLNASPTPIPQEMSAAVERLRTILELNFNLWNEIELRTEFIGPILALIGFYGEGFSAFSGRSLWGKVNDYEIWGEVDWMAATGLGNPETPFFFLHEYKKSVPGASDPFGQLLAAMLVAQSLNDDGQPIYGALVVGSIWRFYLLSGNRFGESVSFDATDPTELPGIWSVLQETKNRIAERVAKLRAEGKA